MTTKQEKKTILITGGAGFIGSNLLEACLSDSRIGQIRILDNLSNGRLSNIEPFLDLPHVDFIEGDIRDYNTCLKACEGMDLVSHQAALGSVPRSIADPLTSNAVNISGTLNMFQAVREAGVERIIFAASSSTYGDSETLPKVEHTIGQPLSPYAVTKYVNELYAQVFADTYDDFRYIGLRYFNVFGPKQDPNNPYAAVIPLFIQAAIDGRSPTIHGDGSNSRDFTYIDNAVQANLKALFVDDERAVNEVYNVACGERTTLTELWDMIRESTGSTVDAEYGPPRDGDIAHSLADVGKAEHHLDYSPTISVRQGLQKLITL